MNEAKPLELDVKAYELAHARLMSVPLELTEADLAQLQIVSPSLVTLAHQAQEAVKRNRTAVKSGSPAVPKKPPLTNKELDALGAGVVTGLRNTRSIMSNVEAVIEEALEQLVELQSIALGLAAIEEQYGTTADLEDARRRHRRLCDQLLEQLRRLLNPDWRLERVH